MWKRERFERCGDVEIHIHIYVFSSIFKIVAFVSFRKCRLFEAERKDTSETPIKK